VELIKSYGVPVIAPKDLIEEYFRLKKLLLDEIFKHVNFSKEGKAHLNFDKDKRKEIRDRFLENWGFAKHYVISLINEDIR